MTRTARTTIAKKNQPTLTCGECGEVFRKGYNRARRARHMIIKHELPRNAQCLGVTMPRLPNRRTCGSWEEFDLILDRYHQEFKRAAREQREREAREALRPRSTGQPNYGPQVVQQNLQPPVSKTKPSSSPMYQTTQPPMMVQQNLHSLTVQQQQQQQVVEPAPEPWDDGLVRDENYFGGGYKHQVSADQGPYGEYPNAAGYYCQYGNSWHPAHGH